MLQWLWAYGEETYATNVKNGSMVRPLDPCKLAALVHGDGTDQCDFIQARIYSSEKKDLANGVLCLFGLFDGWEVFTPSLHHGASHSWYVLMRSESPSID